MELKLGYATPEAVRELFAEYTHMLVAHDPYFQAYLDLQHYDAEVADPTQKYGLPDGRLYVAWVRWAAGRVHRAAPARRRDVRAQAAVCAPRVSRPGHRRGDDAAHPR